MERNYSAKLSAAYPLADAVEFPIYNRRRDYILTAKCSGSCGQGCGGGNCGGNCGGGNCSNCGCGGNCGIPIKAKTARKRR